MVGNSNGIVCDVTKGLCGDDVALSRRRYGKNALTKVRRHSFASKFISNLSDPIIRILIGAMVINAALTIGNINWAETIGIACAVFIAALVSTVSEHGSEKAFDKLNECALKGRSTVLRNGRMTEIGSSELVVCDVLFIRAGMMIPADCVIIDGAPYASESPLTGESTEIKKLPISLYGNVVDPTNLSAPNASKLFKGCLCTRGECKAVVCKVGDSTEYGKIAKGVVREVKKSPLKERLSELAKSVSYLGYVASFMIMTAYLFNAIVVDSGWNTAIMITKLKDVRFMLSTVVSSITLGVSVIVVAVPEGLPMMITVVLSSNVKKMLRSGVLVRKMVGIETAGSMNILFTDKTGTLTTGNMSVNRVYTADGEFTSSREISKHPVFKKIMPPLSDYLMGNAGRTPTENAIINFCKGAKTDFNKSHCIEKLSFNSDNKYSACIYEADGTKKCAVLGAAEKILGDSCEYMTEKGEIRQLDSTAKRRLLCVIERETASCSRVLALAYAKHDHWGKVCCNESCPKVFTALISIRDELRPDAARSVADAKGAGVHVVMITGDNRETARAVAKEAGIIDEEHFEILNGEQIETMDDDSLSSSLPSLAVVSRARPSDKQRLIDIAAKAGLVTGMTGDGINDAPSLKAADVGFAMGSGSDVAKEAADIVLTNDSIASISKAILYGRCVFESIRKFITFQLIMNFCALGVSLICPFIGIDAPITVIQMLWVNIIMDTLGGIAFAGEIPLREYMMRAPIGRKEKILTARMICQILFLGTYTLVLCITFLKVPFVKELFGDGTYFMTCFFALFIFCGIFNSFNARSPRGSVLSHISGNKAFVLIIFTVAVVQLAIIYFGGEVFRCTPLKLRDLATTALISFTVIPIDALRKKLFKA